jgi:hypothetical protein
MSLVTLELTLLPDPLSIERVLGTLRRRRIDCRQIRASHDYRCTLTLATGDLARAKKWLSRLPAVLSVCVDTNGDEHVE